MRTRALEKGKDGWSGWMERTEAVQAEKEQQAALLVMTLERLKPELSGG